MAPAGTMSDLLTLGGSLTSARGINGLGQIAGASTLDGDPTIPLQGLNIPITHAFVSALPTSTQAQAITFDEIADKVFGDVDFTVTATASSGLTVSFAAQGQCTSMGATVHLTGAGDCTITASQAGNATYAPASDVPRSFSIAKGSQAPVVIRRTVEPDVWQHRDADGQRWQRFRQRDVQRRRVDRLHRRG